MENVDYKKKYEEVLETARKINSGEGVAASAGWSTMEVLFPELRESEDERIRKSLVQEFKKKVKKGYEWIEYGIPNNAVLAWLEKQKEQKDKGEISDGYHTFNELYYYRMLYNAAFFNLLPKKWVHKSKKHHDGEECFGGGWFIVMANLPTGQISNHYELKDWDLFQIPEKDVADEWDGHTPQEAAERLYKFLLKGQKPEEWSEEDEKMLNRIIHNFDDLGYEEFCLSSRDQDAPEDRLYFEEIEWLKDLRHKIKQDVPSIIVDESCFKTPINSTDAYYELRDHLFKLFHQYVECETPITNENIDAELSMMYPYMEKYVTSLISNRSPFDDSALRSIYRSGYKEGKDARWKPSKEQMEFLFRLGMELRSDNHPIAAATLEKLYNELKEL